VAARTLAIAISCLLKRALMMRGMSHVPVSRSGASYEGSASAIVTMGPRHPGSARAWRGYRMAAMRMSASRAVAVAAMVTGRARAHRRGSARSARSPWRASV